MTHPELAVKSSGWGGRGYRIPGRHDRFGKQETWPSVTTVLKNVAKPGLNQWIADQVAAYAVTNIARLNNYSDERMHGYLRFYWNREPDLSIARDLRTHHDGVRDDAAELGTNLHESVEALMDSGLTMPVPDAPEVDEMLDAFEAWLDQHRVTVHHQEFTVVDDDGKWAGTADGDWDIECIHEGSCFADGSKGPHRCLVDLKTSRYTWPEHGMQLSALARPDIAMVRVPQGTPGALRFEKTEAGVRRVSWWTERFQPRYDRTVLLHIRPNDLDPKGDLIEAFCELVDETQDLDLHLEGFLGALALGRSAYRLSRRRDHRALRSH